MPTDGRESGSRQRDCQPGPVNTCWQKHGGFSSWLIEGGNDQVVGADCMTEMISR
jgi:hypothetical protein